ncbi:MAG: hypothetical protein RR619_11545, partial [Raoultibacter sp.]
MSERAGQASPHWVIYSLQSKNAHQYASQNFSFVMIFAGGIHGKTRQHNRTRRVKRKSWQG